MPNVTRFAPSPTGFLHLGHAAAALFAHERARPGGRFLLRIEDIDPARCRAAFAEALMEDLAWLGLGWDGAVRFQSDHGAAYDQARRRLLDDGLLYPCFCTRADIAREVAGAAHAPHGPDGAALYPGTCRTLPPAEQQDRIARAMPHAWRIDMTEAVRRTGPLTFHEAGEGRVACRPEAFGDIVLARKDAPSSYHLCVSHDDAMQGVTLVTRGADLKPATSVHRVLQALLGWAEPGYSHHPLLLDAEGRRLSKRDGASTLRAMRAAGVTAAAVLAMVRSARPSR